MIKFAVYSSLLLYCVDVVVVAIEPTQARETGPSRDEWFGQARSSTTQYDTLAFSYSHNEMLALLPLLLSKQNDPHLKNQWSLKLRSLP